MVTSTTTSGALTGAEYGTVQEFIHSLRMALGAPSDEVMEDELALLAEVWKDLTENQREFVDRTVHTSADVSLHQMRRVAYHLPRAAAQ
ncbi:MAG TPA: hypothetical protein VLF67_02075 [Candidatus Saccharimonas sp.]|nr:hypothetical protein [Candidatus Saccharimonas sp.]